MRPIKTASLILSVVILIFALTSCHETPAEDLELPRENCVMVYTISENEYIRILLDAGSQFNFYGEWVKGDKTEAVYLQHYLRPSTFPGDGGLICDIEVFDPMEKAHCCSSLCQHTYSFEKGAMNSSYLFNYDTEEKIPITFSIDENLDFYFSWVSQTYIDFFGTDNQIYKEESQGFWYDFEESKGEWMINDTVVPIRMEFSGVTPLDLTLRIYDISGEYERQILFAEGELTDGSTFIASEPSGDMFYEGTVSEIRIIKRTPEA